MRVRLLGVAASGLTDRQQLPLFGAGDERRRRAIEAVDEIRGRFGSRAIRRARLLDADVRQPFERDPRRAYRAERIASPPASDSQAGTDAPEDGP